MARLPRLAVGTIQPVADLQPILWALMEGLRRSGIQVQSFLSRACFPAHDGATAVTGLAPRHLDSWLMTPDTCRELLVRGAAAADLLLVEGRYGSSPSGDEAGGQLEPLCQWLDLPRLAVVDAAQIDRCRLPTPPRDAEGLLLDRVADDDHLARLTTDLEALWGIPVLGSLGVLAELRLALSRVPRGDRPPQHLCQELGDHFTRRWHPQRIVQIARRSEPPKPASPQHCLCCSPSKLTVAIAYDEAFRCYFPDTLDLLEWLGASIADFSPLRDEGLPPRTDVVYLGCGHPERYAAALSENHCMKAALRSHLRSGRRIYAEGAAAGYLAQQMETPEGDLRRMVGILPATARLSADPTDPVPVQITLARPSWLGEPGARLRGYQNRSWRFEPVAAEAGLVAEPEHRFDLIGFPQAIGSLLHLNFAVQPGFLKHFFSPPAFQPASPDPWAPVA